MAGPHDLRRAAGGMCREEIASAWHYQQVDAVSAAYMRPLRILLAEDVAMVRGALVALIELEPDMKVVAAIERGDYIVSQTLAHHPDVAIIDIDLPGLDGLTAATRLHAALPSCPTLILTNLGRAGNLRRGLAGHRPPSGGVHLGGWRESPFRAGARGPPGRRTGRRS